MRERKIYKCQTFDLCLTLFSRQGIVSNLIATVEGLHCHGPQEPVQPFHVYITFQSS